MASNDQRLPDYQNLQEKSRHIDTKKPNIPGAPRVGAQPSQLTQGGEGGGNVNIGDASGQSNQGSRVGSQYIRPGTTPVSPSTYTPQTSLVSTDTLKKQGLISSTLQPAIALGKLESEGASKFGSDVVKGGVSTGNLLFGEGAFNIPTAPTSTSTSNPANASSKVSNPKDVEATSGTSLGTFTTPTGGSAVVTRPGGAPAFTKEQQSSLQAILNREASPEFKAKLAEQAAIVEASREQTRLGDIRRAGDATGALDQQAIDKFIRSNIGSQGAAHAAQLRLGKQAESDIRANEYDTKRQIAEQEAQAKGVTEVHKARSENLKNYYSSLSDNAKAFGTPSQRFQIAKSHFGTVTESHMPDILGPDFAEYANLENPQDKRDYLTKLGIGL